MWKKALWFVSPLFLIGGIVWAVELNTSGKCTSGAACEIGLRASSLTFGDSGVGSITLTTDGTGNAEVVLPTGSIATGEILDETIASADILNGTIATGDVAADTLTFANISDSSAIDADTTFTAADGIQLTLTPSYTSGDVNFFTINADQVDDAAATDDFDVFRMDLTSESGDAGDTFDGLVIIWEDGTANTIMDSAIKIDNSEDTASTMTDAIIVTSSGVNAGVTDAIDVSASNITNAINVGANTVTFGANAGAIGDSSATSIVFTDDTAAITFDAGKITSTGASDFGWTVQTGVNTACTTTCTTPAVFGVDSGGTGLIVGPSDATAEECLCAGGS